MASQGSCTEGASRPSRPHQAYRNLGDRTVGSRRSWPSRNWQGVDRCMLCDRSCTIGRS